GIVSNGLTISLPAASGVFCSCESVGFDDGGSSGPAYRDDYVLIGVTETGVVAGICCDSSNFVLANIFSISSAAVSDVFYSCVSVDFDDGRITGPTENIKVSTTKLQQ
ncbi:hypothetical protein Tco_1008973, partial [Tanacetum coccineum]